MSSSSFPVSASECTASLIIAELPVIAAAANFVAATRTFPISAALTTRLDSVLPIEVVAPTARRRPQR